MPSLDMLNLSIPLGLGQAAIHLAKHIGAQIFATAGSETKRQLLMDEFGLSADRIFDSREHLFAKGITKMTNGRGVDVILNSTSGATLRKTWECISTFGRFLDVEKRDTLSNNGLNIKPFSRNVTLVGINLEVRRALALLSAFKANLGKAYAPSRPTESIQSISCFFQAHLRREARSHTAYQCA